MANNKIIFGDEVLIDLTSDSVEPQYLAKGKTAHDKSGTVITGTNTFDADTSDADATASEILENKSAYVNGVKIKGEMINRGAVDEKISNKEQEYIIQNGYHDGSGKVSIDDTEKAKIIGANIKAGVYILGVEGTYAGESIKAQSKTVDPLKTKVDVLPDQGFDYLSQVTVNPIYYNEAPNPQGGTTVTIGKVATA